MSGDVLDEQKDSTYMSATEKGMGGSAVLTGKSRSWHVLVTYGSRTQQARHLS